MFYCHDIFNVPSILHNSISTYPWWILKQIKFHDYKNLNEHLQNIIFIYYLMQGMGGGDKICNSTSIHGNHDKVHLNIISYTFFLLVIKVTPDFIFQNLVIHYKKTQIQFLPYTLHHIHITVTKIKWNILSAWSRVLVKS